MLQIFFWEQCFVSRNLPVDAEAAVQDANSSVGLWGIEVVALVLEDGGFAEDGKAVGKATRYEELEIKTLSCLP